MPTQISELLDRLARFETSEFPVISLYLNAAADSRGRDSFAPFLRKEMNARAKTYELRSPARLSFDKDVERIEEYLQQQLEPSSNSVAIFACSGAGDFFEAAQLSTPLAQHEIYIDSTPHLYTLARMEDQSPRYAAVLTDTNSARIFVFELSRMVDAQTLESTKMKRTQAGGWSQARYQRHVENYHLHHAKEVLSVLERVVREEGIQHIVFAGDEVVIPLLQEQLPQALKDKVIDVLRLKVAAPEDQILNETRASLRRHDAKTDAEQVEAVLNDYRAGGLAAVGVNEVLSALANPQVDEVFLCASPRELPEELNDKPAESNGSGDGASGQGAPQTAASGQNGAGKEAVSQLAAEGRASGKAAAQESNPNQKTEGAERAQAVRAQKTNGKSEAASDHTPNDTLNDTPNYTKDQSKPAVENSPAATAEAADAANPASPATVSPEDEEWRAELAEEIVTKAMQTSAKVRFIEDPALLASIGGVGARLRYRL